MSSVQVITSIIILLAALVCYAFVSQTIRAKKEQQQRVLAALRRRNNTFKFMINGFPKGFLSKELSLLVQRSLIETLEQLAKVEASNPAHTQDLQMVSSQMVETQRASGPPQVTKLENPAQIKEVKMCLEELYRFVHLQEKKNLLPGNQADNFRSQIKQLSLQISVDSYVLRGKSSMQSDKFKVAYHYFDLALNLLVREGRGSTVEARAAEIREILKELEPQIEGDLTSATMTEEERAEQEGIDNEWDQFSDKDDFWKKKHAYD